MIDLFESAQHRIAGEIVELLAAQIIVASLHVADVELAFAIGEKRLLEERNIFMKKLLLQIFRACRDDDALAGADDRQQIGERLAGAGSRLDDQVAPFLECLFDGLRHLQLAAAKLVGGMSFREHAAGREKLVERESGSRSFGMRRGMGGRGHGVSIIAGWAAQLISASSQANFEQKETISTRRDRRAAQRRQIDALQPSDWIAARDCRRRAGHHARSPLW